ncbi:MAG: hypothetical protein NUV34_10095 [Sulfuricaulis sp.]|nr:hypothetical protein [Sulfuricaulis sp.]
MTSRTPCHQMRHFRDHVIERPAEFLATRVGHDAEAAILAAAFHDRDQCPHAVHPRLGQAVEFLDFGERNIHRRLVVGQDAVQHLRQAVQGLRAEYHVHVRRAPYDRRAFLAGNAAANANNQAGTRGLQLAPQAQLREHLLLRFLADGTGIKEQYVGLGRVVRGFQPVAGRKRVRHARGVVLVHLAAEGFDMQLAGHVPGRATGTALNLPSGGQNYQPAIKNAGGTSHPRSEDYR